MSRRQTNHGHHSKTRKSMEPQERLDLTSSVAKIAPKLPRFKISFLALTHFLLNEQRAIVNKVIDINGKMCNATLGNHIETTWYTIFLNIIYLISVINKVIDNGKL